MRQSVVFLLLVLLVVSCQNGQKNTPSERFWLPEAVQTVYKINQKDVFLSATQNNAFWKEINLQEIVPDVVTILNNLPLQGNFWLAFTPQNTYLVANLQENPIENSLIEQILAQNSLKTKWFFVLEASLLIVSSDKDLQEQLKKEGILEKNAINTLLSSADAQSMANVFIQKEGIQGFLQTFFEQNLTQYFADWLAIDLRLSENDIQLSGTALSASEYQGKQGKVTDPTDEVVKIMPSNTLQYVNYAKSGFWQGETPFEKSVRGVAFSKNETMRFCFVASEDATHTLGLLPVLQEDLQVDFPLFELAKDVDIAAFFGQFEQDFSPKYVCLYDDFLIFAPEKSFLLFVMEQIRTQNTLFFNTSYTPIEQEMASSVGVTQAVDLQSKADFVQKFPKIAQHYRWASFQVTARNDHYIFSFISKKQPVKPSEVALSERFEFVLGTELLTTPQILTNHRTKRLEIAVQDTQHNLYLIGNTGNLLWKKKLDGKIQSKIHQVDLFKNGYLQMAFSTENSVWVIDRNGNTVNPFPKKYDEKISALAVYDYEGNLDYRFIFAQGNKIHLLDGKGQVVSGFSPPTETATLLHTPVHFRTQNMDFLVYGTTQGDFRILHRNGAIRIAVAEKFPLSADLPLLSADKFMMKTQNATVVSVSLQGEVTHQQTTQNGLWVANRHTMAQIVADSLHVGSHVVPLPSSEFKDLKMFRIRGVNYVAATDPSTNLVYLWDDTARLVHGFPLEGQTIDMHVDLDKKVWIAVTKNADTLSVYETDTLKTQ